MSIHSSFSVKVIKTLETQRIPLVDEFQVPINVIRGLKGNVLQKRYFM